MNKETFIYFTIMWFFGHYFVITQVPEEYGILGKILMVLFAISFFCGILYLAKEELKNEKKE